MVPPPSRAASRRVSHPAQPKSLTDSEKSADNETRRGFRQQSSHGSGQFTPSDRRAPLADVMTDWHVPHDP
ncbi:hypothetical protein J6590_004287 [Homalodisca vitripennis]|nr:hypothetical protein J6590_004287 [Homalodisca vitripennis]